MRKAMKKVITLMLALAMVFSIQLTASAAPADAKSNTDVPNPLEELFKKLGIGELLEGVEFETLPSGNTLMKVKDEEDKDAGAMLMATKGPLTLGDYQAAGDLSKGMASIVVCMPKQYESVISADITGYLKDIDKGLLYLVTDNILNLENEKDMENFKLYYIWSIETIKKAVPLNPVIQMNPKGYDEILDSVDGKGVIAHFENEGVLPGEAEIIATFSGEEGKFEDSEEFSLYYINDEKGTLDFVNNEAMLMDDSAEFTITHTSDYLIADTTELSGGKADVNKTNRNNVKKSPQTGDNSMASVYIILAGASVLTLMAGRKKRNA